MAFEITHDRDKRIFRAVVDGKEGYLKYREIGPTMIEIIETFVHSSVFK